MYAFKGNFLFVFKLRSRLPNIFHILKLVSYANDQHYDGMKSRFRREGAWFVGSMRRTANL